MQDMKAWTEYISSLPDEKFFYIMRLYLGDIKTPFNKVRLTEQLASFVRTKSNLDNMVALLDETDVKILTAIHLLPGITYNTLKAFFDGEYSFSLVSTRLTNLQDRLLIFYEKKSYSEEFQFKINPLVEEEIKPYLNPDLVFPEPSMEQTSFETPFMLSPNFLAAFISYINITGCGLKANGEFRKTDREDLEEIFGDKLKCLQFLVNAFVNLQLVREGEKNLTVVEKHFETFCNLDETTQYIFLAVASVMRLSRDGLKKQCQLLADTLASVPECGVTKKTFLRMTQFIAGRPSEEKPIKTVSRFSELLNRARAEGEAQNISDAISLMDSVFDAAVEFGLLTLYGEAEDGSNVYVKGFCNDKAFTFNSEKPKVLNINAASSVTLLPGLSLKDLLPLTFFMQAVKCSTVTEYEISRASVSSGFDKGYSLDKITKLLSAYATFELPQNLLFNLEEWHNAYSSAVLYKGYVLKVSPENISLVENNPALSVHVKEKLAEGIYLLDIPVTENPSAFIKDSGLDFMGSIKTIEKEVEIFSLPRISEGVSSGFGKRNIEYLEISEEQMQKTEDKLLNLLKESNLGELQNESLQTRILNHLIVSESQLVSSSVRTEVIKADGMDFHGKIHLIDSSIKNNDILELTLPKNGEEEIIRIRPVKLIKSEGEAVLKYELPPDKEQHSYPVSRIMHIKRIRT